MTNDLLVRAVEYLAGVCDGARLQDDAGFNRFDSPFGKQLAALSSWTPRQRRAAWEMIRKYKKQLTVAGIDFDSIPEPEKLSVYTSQTPRRLVEKSRTISIGDSDLFEIRFPYDTVLISAIKNLPGARFSGKNPTDKYWTTPVTFEIAEKLLAFAQMNNFTLSTGADQRLHSIAKLAEQNLQESTSEHAELVIPGLRGTLRPFQAAGIQYARRMKRTFIADEMGLGKTVEAIATIEAEQAYPAIIVCPASLKPNWKREITYWLPNRHVQILEGREPSQIAKVVNFIILNYDILGQISEEGSYFGWVDALRAINPKAVVFDESHYVKGHRTARTKLSRFLATGWNSNLKYNAGSAIPLRLLLTGTPIVNRPAELISQLQIIERLNDLGGFRFFTHHYCGAGDNEYGSPDGAKNLPELATRLRSTCMIRRMKEDVLKELPKKAPHAIITLALSNRKEYDKAATDLIMWLAENEGAAAAARASEAEQLVRIEKLKQLAAKGKLKGAIEWINTFLDSDEKLVIFVSHIDIQKTLLKEFPGAARILGSDNPAARDENVIRFQKNLNCKLIVCSLAAGGVGITLTAAKNVAFLELGWTPAVHDQAEDRLHRIGQEGLVTPWYLLAENSIDDEIYALIEEKRSIVTGATGVGESAILKELIHRLGKKARKEVH